jgi:ATP-dependent exoDNAse (exonuclease V) alpha subunit
MDYRSVLRCSAQCVRRRWLKENDRVLLVGDTRQHEAVEAGRPYQQLQEAGIETARLDEIVRQKDPALKEVVEQLSRGNVREAIERLDAQGRVHEIPDRDERLKEIAHGYAKKAAQSHSTSKTTRISTMDTR